MCAVIYWKQMRRIQIVSVGRQLEDVKFESSLILQSKPLTSPCAWDSIILLPVFLLKLILPQLIFKLRWWHMSWTVGCKEAFPSATAEPGVLQCHYSSSTGCVCFPICFSVDKVPVFIRKILAWDVERCL